MKEVFDFIDSISLSTILFAFLLSFLVFISGYLVGVFTSGIGRSELEGELDEARAEIETLHTEAKLLREVNEQSISALNLVDSKLKALQGKVKK